MIQSSQREDLYFRSNGNMIIAKNNHQPKSFPPHWHQYGEFIFVQSGELTVTISEKLYQMKTGSMLFIYPCEMHSIQSANNQQAVLMQFDLTLINHFPSIMLCWQKNHNRKRLIEQDSSPELFDQLKKLVEDIFSLQSEAQTDNLVSFYDVRQYLLLCQMILLVLEREQALPNTAMSDDLENRNDIMQIMQNVCAYINRNFTEELTQSQVAEYAGLSVSYFSKIFRQYTNCSFNTYLSRFRLSNAKLMLADKKTKITDAAFLSGFQSLASFNRIFSNYEGMSPSEFRRLYNNL